MNAYTVKKLRKCIEASGIYKTCHHFRDYTNYGGNNSKWDSYAIKTGKCGW